MGGWGRAGFTGGLSMRDNHWHEADPPRRSSRLSAPSEGAALGLLLRAFRPRIGAEREGQDPKVCPSCNSLYWGSPPGSRKPSRVTRAPAKPDFLLPYVATKLPHRE